MVSRTKTKFSHSSLLSQALASELISERQRNIMGLQEKHMNLKEEVSCCGKITSMGISLIVLWG
jgi:hypothetical protein